MVDSIVRGYGSNIEKESGELYGGLRRVHFRRDILGRPQIPEQLNEYCCTHGRMSADRTMRFGNPAAQLVLQPLEKGGGQLPPASIREGGKAARSRPLGSYRHRAREKRDRAAGCEATSGQPATPLN
jgi:hypothetical protein